MCRAVSTKAAEKDWEPLGKFVRSQFNDRVPEGTEFLLSSWRYNDSPVLVTAAFLPLDTWVTPDTEDVLSERRG